eukprot:Lithocolla_globosa_v1_NODE_590_length_3668_cov_68.691392.p2 type:complete len:142 gc:universal NODE_590_length_3668_cov_68.691392:1913-1488(-)
MPSIFLFCFFNTCHSLCRNFVCFFFFIFLYRSCNCISELVQFCFVLCLSGLFLLLRFGAEVLLLVHSHCCLFCAFCAFCGLCFLFNGLCFLFNGLCCLFNGHCYLFCVFRHMLCWLLKRFLFSFNGRTLLHHLGCLLFHFS